MRRAVLHSSAAGAAAVAVACAIVALVLWLAAGHLAQKGPFA